MAKKSLAEIVEEFEYKGIKLGQKVKVGYYADKEETVIGADTEGEQFIITNSKNKVTIGISLKDEINNEGFTGIKILKGYENLDALQWTWADKEYLNIVEVK